MKLISEFFSTILSQEKEVVSRSLPSSDAFYTVAAILLIALVIFLNIKRNIKRSKKDKDENKDE